jgi:type IV pilus assembly protein PilO
MSALGTRPAAVTTNVRQRATGWLSLLNLHIAGVAILGAVCLYLLVHMLIVWQLARGDDADALAQANISLQTARIAAKPLEGLDTKLERSSADASEFYTARLPVSYSEFVAELGAVAKRNGVRLARVQYTPSVVAGDASGQLTEVKMDASLTGDYKPLVLFLNGLERDKVFFLIRSISLSGQQSGTVNLRIGLTTYLRDQPSDDEVQRVETDVDSTAGAASGGTASTNTVPAGGTR